MIEYKVGSDLEKDTHLILSCLVDLNVSYNCHEGAEVFCNILKKFSHKVEVVRGFYSSRHLRNGEYIQHSWVENIINIYGLSKIIETAPNQMFPELNPEEQCRSMVVLPDDEKRDRYHSVLESIMEEVLRRSKVRIDKKRMRHLSKLVEQCINKRLEYLSKTKRRARS